MNEAANASTSYKVIFFARHGEGVHNVAEEWYGAAAWYGYWAEQDGNGTAVWMDAHLTDTGVAQAQQLGQAWQHQISPAVGTPTPQSYYTSPLNRCCATAYYTFANLSLPLGTPFIPTVKENLRELIGVVTEDERSNATYIASQFPSYQFEEGFTEDDELWQPDVLELPWQLDARMTGLLEDVWQSDKSTWISFTSHQLATASMLRVIGHQSFTLGTAGMLPVLIESVIS
jgi:broad specificity phosphatase PhoE